MKKAKSGLSTTHLILLSFLAAIFVGALVLCLPISSASGQWVPFTDALFTSTTATCVTGLVVVPTVSSWSLFGQVVILILIQIGGLGIITVMSGIAVAFHRRMGLSDRLLLQDVFNLNTLSGLVRFLKKVILGTFVIEGIGALLYMTVFVPQFGAKGIWISVFTSISAFCNAGIDIIAENSLCGYVNNPIINFVTSALIILGGIGYIVWWDVIRVLRLRKRTKIKLFKSLTLHSKIALSATLLLIFAGGAAIFAFEYNNPLTIGNMSLFDKLQASFFQSITTRTAGFATVAQENLSNGGAVVCLLLMFIGGSPVGTAGGVKTVTMAILFCSAVSVVKGKESTDMFNRTISSQAISKAVAVVATSFLTVFVSTVLLCAVTDTDLLNVLFETVSATATVGLTRNLTSSLGTAGKLIITATMYFGRVGPISLAFAFKTKRSGQPTVSNPVEEISVG